MSTRLLWPAPGSAREAKAAISCMWLAVLCMVLAACATPQLTSAWKDPAYTGPPLRKVLVIGVSRSDVHRRVFEDGFAKALIEAGIGASPSYPLLPESGSIPNERIKQAVAQAGADAVLVTRVLRIDRHVEVTPGYVGPAYGRGFYGWYGGAWTTIPPSIDQYDVLTIESTLWDMRREKIVWSGTSEATEPKDVAKLTASLAKVLIAKMKEDKVL